MADVGSWTTSGTDLNHTKILRNISWDDLEEHVCVLWTGQIGVLDAGKPVAAHRCSFGAER